MGKKYSKEWKASVRKWAALAFAVALAAACGCLYHFVIDNIAEEVTIEAGTPPSPESFLVRHWNIPVEFETAIQEINVMRPGDYPVRLLYCHRSYDTVLRIRDTTPPLARARDLTVLATDSFVPEDFLDSVWDATPVTATFGVPPDLTKGGLQQISILLTDKSGNTAEVHANVTVIIDSQPPVIEGVQESFLIYQGDTISYRAGVTVTDNMDENPALTIDSSQVDLSTPGEYAVTYTATDSFGNTAVAVSKVTVLEKKENYVDLETIHEAVAELLSTIVREDMTAEQQVRAIHGWIRDHCTYIYHSNKEDYHQSGYAMLKKRVGDCYGYFSLCKLMLEELEIPNIDVVKVKNYPGDSDHYWSMVSVDGGEIWYHLDTSPRPGGTEFCLVSDAYLDNFSKHYRNCFNRDKSLYPATPEDNL